LASLSPRMRRCRPVTVALLIALVASLTLAPLARAQTTSVLPGTSIPVPSSTTAPPTTAAAPTTTPPPSTATIQTTATPQTAAPTTTATPASDGPGTDSNDSKLPVLLLAILGAILLASALAFAAVRWWAYDPPWLVRSRHATAEAGWRTSAAWAEFRDWLRIGR
jgi:hypothetical protein